MLEWFSKSLKNKFFITLVLFGLVPLLVLGISTNVLFSRTLIGHLDLLAEQNIQKLTLIISKDLQGFLDTAVYQSTNSIIASRIKDPFKNQEDKETVFYALKNELINTNVLNRVNYPFHYIIISKDNTIFTNFTYSTTTVYKDLSDKLSINDWLILLKSSYPNKLWMGHHDHYLSRQGAHQIYIASSIIDNMENVGVVMLGVDEHYIAKLLKNVSMSNRSSIYLLDSSGDCLVQGEDNYYKFLDLPEDFRSIITDSNNIPHSVKISDKEQIIIHDEMYLSGLNKTFQIVMIAPKEDIYSDINMINNVTYLLVSLCLIAILIMQLVMNKSIINPIINLNRNIMDVRNGNLEVKVAEDKEDEIGQLGYGFNDMVRNLKKYIRNIQDEEAAKRELEIMALQSQINPHFVRNTLNTIRWMAEIMKVPAISHAITSFIRLVDYNFASSSVFVTVREEIKLLEEYTYLQRLRYSNKFRFSLNISEDIMNCLVLKLSFQPIVENSIIHGMEGNKGLGNLCLKGTREGETLIFCVKDDGIGMSKETLEGIFCAKSTNVSRKGIGGIGLYNVQKRIKLNFGEQYGITINSSPQKGTEVQMVLPVILDNTSEGEDYEDTDCR